MAQHIPEDHIDSTTPDAVNVNQAIKEPDYGGVQEILNEVHVVSEDSWIQAELPKGFEGKDVDVIVRLK